MVMSFPFATRLLVAFAVAVALLARPAVAGPPAPPNELPELTLVGTDGASHALRAEAAKAKLLVVTFFSATCPCQRAHDARLRELWAEWHPRGVELVAVDSEAGSTLDRDRAEAKERQYPYPILSDPGAKLADALGAVYATHTVVLDPRGKVRYRGGIDSSRAHIKLDGKFFLREALVDLLEGREPRDEGSKVLGCFLRRS